MPPILAEEQEIVTLTVSLAYPFLDILLLSITLPAFLLFMKGTFWKPLLFIIVGILLTLIADLLFSWTTLNGSYYNGHPLELFSHWSYLAFAFGFYLRLKQARMRVPFGGAT